MAGDIEGRGNDATYVTYRDAVMMFASKDELVAMRQAIDVIQSRLGLLPTRDEWNLRKEADDDFRAETKAALERTNNALLAASTALAALPGALLWKIGSLVAGIVFFLVSVATLVNFFLQHWKAAT
jgi:hypothetical protein